MSACFIKKGENRFNYNKEPRGVLRYSHDQPSNNSKANKGLNN
jgi:hypothetical protein